MDQLEIILQDEYRLQILRERLVQRGDVRPSAAFERSLRSMLRIYRFYPSDALPWYCLLYTSPSPRDRSLSRMPSSA